MSIIKKLAKHTFVYGLSSVLARILNYLLVPLHTRVFTQSELGLITEIYIYAAFMNVVYTYGLETTYFRFSKGSQNTKALGNIFTLITISTIIISSILYVLLPYVSGYLNYNNSEIYLKYIVWIVTIDALTVIPLCHLRLIKQSHKFAKIQVIRIITNVGLNILFFIIIKNWD